MTFFFRRLERGRDRDPDAECGGDKVTETANDAVLEREPLPLAVRLRLPFPPPSAVATAFLDRLPVVRFVVVFLCRERPPEADRLFDELITTAFSPLSRFD